MKRGKTSAGVVTRNMYEINCGIQKRARYVSSASIQSVAEAGARDTMSLSK